MSEALANLLKQAEAQKLQLELNLQLQQNLLLFKDRFPKLYKLFENYQPQNVVLQLDPNNELNLVDKRVRQFIYNTSVKKYFDQQYTEFCTREKLRRFHIIKSPEANPRHLHIRHLNSLIEAYTEKKATRINHTPAFITNLILPGVGLAFHLPKLITDFDIRNILINETCKDTFFAALHTIDWRPILDYFRQENRSIAFCVGVSPSKALAQIESAVHKIGLHSQVFTFVYQHTLRSEETEFVATYMKELRAYLGGLGFYDDEQTGFAHAVHNLKNRKPVFVSRRQHHRKPRLLLVGNGPSLDFHTDYIKENRQNVVVMSCGTAIGTLLKLGIQPDIHIECERINFVKDYLKHYTSPQQREQIMLLCLHTAAPEVLQLFPQSCYSIKPNDAGSPLIKHYLKDAKLQELPFCNPTVTNCALSFAIAMGFMDIHLIGVDFGMTDDGKHHASNSVYDDMNRARYNGKLPPRPKKTNEPMVPGNFGGEVETRHVWDMSRIAMQRLLELARRSFPNFSCRNTNRGAKIEYAETVALEDMPPCPSVDKQACMAALPEDHFYRPPEPVETIDPKKDYLTYLFAIKDKLRLADNLATEQELYQEMCRVYQLIAENKDAFAHQLLRGSLNCFFGSIVENSFYCKDKQAFRSQVQLGVDRFNEFIGKVYEQMESDPFVLDDTIDKNIALLTPAKATPA